MHILADVLVPVLGKLTLPLPLLEEEVLWDEIEETLDRKWGKSGDRK